MLGVRSEELGVRSEVLGVRSEVLPGCWERLDCVRAVVSPLLSGPARQAGQQLQHQFWFSTPFGAFWSEIIFLRHNMIPFN